MSYWAPIGKSSICISTPYTISRPVNNTLRVLFYLGGITRSTDLVLEYRVTHYRIPGGKDSSVKAGQD